MSRSISTLVLLLLPVACAVGNNDAGTLSFSGGAYTVGEDGSDDSTDGESATSGQTSTASGGGTSVGDATGDTGDPACCMVSSSPGCGSPDTEACVCAGMPSCCQAVWGAECVDLAIACGDPYCVDDTTGDDDTTGAPPLECDAGFAFIPGSPAPNASFEATFTDPQGLTHIGMHAEGPNGELVDGTHVQPITGMFTWHFDFPGLAAGLWTFTFTWRVNENDPDIVRGTCHKQF